MKVDLGELVTRQQAAVIYGATPQAFDYLAKRGYIRPIFESDHTKLYLRQDVLRLKKIVLPAGRPRKIA